MYKCHTVYINSVIFITTTDIITFLHFTITVTKLLYEEAYLEM